MESLSDKLRSRGRDEPLLGTRGGWQTAGRLLDVAEDLRNGPFATMKGAGVCLCFDRPESFVAALVALDGWASSILLSDAGASEEHRKRFEEAAELEFRTDGSEVECSGYTRVATPSGSVRTRWIIPTSGTTGEPKLVGHTWASLSRTIKPPNDFARSLRWGLLYEPSRFAGLQVLLQALAGGSALIIPDDFRDMELAIETLACCGCNALSATPSLWRKLTITGLLKALDLKVATLGGETADQRILDILAQTFPEATIRHIYASTEAGVGFSVADRTAGFPSTFLETHPPGVQIKISPEGMLLLKPEALEQVYLGRSDPLQREDGWIETGDLVETWEDRVLFLGRANGSINVGGQKVHPSKVEQVILEVSGVNGVRVFGKPNPILGALVAVEIVADPGADLSLLKKEVVSFCARHLQRHEVPALVYFTDQLQLISNGKLQR